MTAVRNEYLELYRTALAHERSHQRSCTPSQPSYWGCCDCLESGAGRFDYDVRRQFSWAIPDEAALAAIAEHAPRGVVEIGAGGGYWAMLLRERGVDVVAYDPAPEPSRWGVR